MKDSSKFSEKVQSRLQQSLHPAPILQLSNNRFSNCTTKSQLDQFRKNSDYQISTNFNFHSHKGPETRLQERENLYNLSPPPGRTHTSIKERTRKSDNAHLIDTFSNQRLGIHGEELPKFHQNIQIFCENTHLETTLKGFPDLSHQHKFLKKPNLEIANPPHKIDFSPENYRAKSQYLRVRDKSVGAVRRSKHLKNSENLENSSKPKPVIFLSGKLRSRRSIRSRGFMF